LAALVLQLLFVSEHAFDMLSVPVQVQVYEDAVLLLFPLTPMEQL
jgi:hypothetical protein